MSDDVGRDIPDLIIAEFRPVVRQVLGGTPVPHAPIALKKIGRGAGVATAGIYQVTGLISIAAGEQPWSAVVKVLGRPEHPRAGITDGSRNEAEIYRSRAFANRCGGIRAAHCYTIQDHDELQLLWLEDLSGAPQPPWQIAHFIETARHLGQFNAHWPESTLPDWWWLNRSGFRASFQSPYQCQLFQQLPALHNHPLVQRLAPPAVLPALMQLWAEMGPLLSQAERSPKGICHRDCHPKNLFPLHEDGTASCTVAIDWAAVGIDCFGVDIGHLLGSPMLWQELTPDEAEALMEPLFTAYMTGLSDAGWRGNQAQVRLTFLTRLACDAIRATSLVISAINNPNWSLSLERLIGFPIEELCTGWGKVLHFALACKEEAARLANQR